MSHPYPALAPQSHPTPTSETLACLPEDGLYHVETTKNGPTAKRVCDPIIVTNKFCDAKTSQWGSSVSFRMPNREYKTVAFLHSELAKNNFRQVTDRLINEGLTPPDPSDFKKIVQYILSHEANQFALLVEQPGFHEHHNAVAFALGSQILSTAPHHFVTHPNMSELAFATGGTAKGWHDGVSRLCRGNPIPTLAICLALSGPLHAAMGRPAFGVHLHGKTTRGKTTTGLIAISTIDAPQTSSPAFIEWWGTTNGTEQRFQLLNGLFVVVDEIALADSKHLLDVIYLAPNGKPKLRFRSMNSQWKNETWTAPFISTGEIGTVQKAAEKDHKMKEGQLIRLLNVPIGETFSIFPELHGHVDEEDIAEAFELAMGKHYGHAFRSFVYRISADLTGATSEAQQLCDEFVECVTTRNVAKEVRRVARFLGLQVAAGVLASRWKIVAWDEAWVFKAYQQIFTHWRANFLGDVAKVSDPADLISGQIDKIRAFLSTNAISRFAPWDMSPNPRLFQRVDCGFRRTDKKGNRVFMLYPEKFAELCGDQDIDEVAIRLKEDGYLIHNKDRLKTFQKPRAYPKGRYFYGIRENFFTEPDEPIDDIFGRLAAVTDVVDLFKNTNSSTLNVVPQAFATTNEMCACNTTGPRNSQTMCDRGLRKHTPLLPQLSTNPKPIDLMRVRLWLAEIENRNGDRPCTHF